MSDEILIERPLAPSAARASVGRSSRPATALFVGASTLSAGLLFSVQPMAGRALLPRYGGAPAVWNTSMLLFQLLLLVGYGYAHVATRRSSPRRQPWLHLALLLLPVAALPIAAPDATSGAVTPVLGVASDLVVMVGVPFLLLSTTGPLLQRWLSWTDHPDRGDPYVLYAASNAGSLAALLAYPVAIEPYLSVRSQFLVWSSLYVLLVGLLGLCAAYVARRSVVAGTTRPVPQPRGHRLGVRRQLRWFVLAALPSSLMLGVTTHLTTDVAAVPLLWVVPLALYLGSFILAFGRRTGRLVDAARLTFPVAAIVSTADLFQVVEFPVGVSFAVHLALLASAATSLHGRLAADRPSPVLLTRFYLIVAAGGAFGGAINAILAPVLFDRTIEYPLALAGAVLLAAGWRGQRSSTPVRDALELVVALGGIVALAALDRAGVTLGTAAGLAVALVCGVAGTRAIRRPPLAIALAVLLVSVPHTGLAAGILEVRSFFGTHRVAHEGDRHVLSHGSTVHGWQQWAPEPSPEPQSYYHRDGPLGQIFETYGDRSDEVRIIGLGAGTVASYGRAGQRMTFHEIDPVVVRIAEDRSLFTFLASSEATVDIVVGDGRSTVAAAGEDVADLLIIDAFSSDAIPVHLLTREAFGIYLSALRPGGVIAVHVSNDHLDIAPVAVRTARSVGAAAVVGIDREETEGKAPSVWVAVADSPSTLSVLEQGDRWTAEMSPGRAWTDDRADVFGALRWFSR